MRELQRRQKIKQILYSTPSLLVFAALTFFLAKGAINMAILERQSADTAKELEKQAAALSLRQAELETQIERLQTEEGVIDEIKRKFSVIKAGEYMAVIVDEKLAPASEEESEKSWYGKIWDAIMPK